MFIEDISRQPADINTLAYVSAVALGGENAIEQQGSGDTANQAHWIL
jgi:hypothetical protein